VHLELFILLFYLEKRHNNFGGDKKMAEKKRSLKNAHKHTRPEKYRDVFLGPDNQRLAKVYEEYAKEFPSGIPK